MKGKEADAKKSLKQFFTAERPDAYTLEDLRGILRILRSDEGCPWDRNQTFETMVPCVLEEAGEVAEAVRNQDTENLCEMVRRHPKIFGGDLPETDGNEGDLWERIKQAEKAKNHKTT